MTRAVHVFRESDQLSIDTADAVVEVINSNSQTRMVVAPSFFLAETRLADSIDALAAKPPGTVPWPAVHVFWGDERLVAADDARRNDRMAREMLLQHVPCPNHTFIQWHRMRCLRMSRHASTRTR